MYRITRDLTDLVICTADCSTLRLLDTKTDSTGRNLPRYGKPFVEVSMRKIIFVPAWVVEIQGLFSNGKRERWQGKERVEMWRRNPDEEEKYEAKLGRP